MKVFHADAIREFAKERRPELEQIWMDWIAKRIAAAAKNGGMSCFVQGYEMPHTVIARLYALGYWLDSREGLGWEVRWGEAEGFHGS